MPKSSFSISSIFGWLKQFLSRMSSPIYGFDIQDVKAKEEGDIYSSYYQFETSNITSSKPEEKGEPITDVNGNPIKVDVLIKAINVRDTYQPLYDGMNALYGNDELLDVLLGKDRENDEYKRNSGKGLLGLDLSKPENLKVDVGTYAGVNWKWDDVARQKLLFGLECESPGKDYGAITNETLDRCGSLIAEYLYKSDIIKSVYEVQVESLPLVLPILILIQGKLAEYYVSARNKFLAEEDKRKNQNQKNNPPEEGTEEPSEEEGTEAPPEGAGAEGESPMATPSSKQIKVTLRKIQGSEDLDLLGLQTTCPPSDTLNYVDDIINQDEFLEALTEEPQTFNIDIDDDGYDIEQCETCEIDPCDSLSHVLRTAISMYRNLYIIHWMAKGNDMMKLHLLSEELYEELIKEIDTLGELMVEKCGTVIPLDFGWNPLAVKSYEFQESLSLLTSLIQTYIDTIDCAYPNQTSDVQSTFDEWLRYWNKQMNYFIKNQEN